MTIKRTYKETLGKEGYIIQDFNSTIKFDDYGNNKTKCILCNRIIDKAFIIDHLSFSHFYLSAELHDNELYLYDRNKLEELYKTSIKKE